MMFVKLRTLVASTEFPTRSHPVVEVQLVLELLTQISLKVWFPSLRTMPLPLVEVISIFSKVRLMLPKLRLMPVPEVARIRMSLKVAFVSVAILSPTPDVTFRVRLMNLLPNPTLSTPEPRRVVPIASPLVALRCMFLKVLLLLVNSRLSALLLEVIFPLSKVLLLAVER